MLQIHHTLDKVHVWTDPTTSSCASCRIKHVGAALQVAETCQLALQRIERCQNGAAAGPGEDSPYLSVDPMQVYPA